MRGTIIYGLGDVRSEELPEPGILAPTDAIVRNTASCVCGTDLWGYRGIDPVSEPMRIGHEYCGVVEDVGSDVRSVKPGQFVIGSFFASDGTCRNCHNGFHTSCVRGEFMSGCQAELVRVPMADGSLLALADHPDDDMIPDLLALSDVMGTGWFAADVANVSTGMTVVVVGDGAVGQCAVLAAREKGAERIIVMSRHEWRRELARAFGATDIVTERGRDGIAVIKDMTEGVGADAVLECVGSTQSTLQPVGSARPGAVVGLVGFPHDVSIQAEHLFFNHVGIHGGAAPVRRFLPHLVELVLNGRINPGKVFDLRLPLDQVARAYQAMDERRAIKALLQP